jgi:hypothetical protein
MLRPFRSAHHEAPPSEVQAFSPEHFDYSPLAPEVARQVQTAAQRLRQLVERTLQDLVVVGRELLAVKGVLPHGRFGPWLRAEFGWTERTARHFMAVAQRFGTKTEMISDLRIDPTAAYLLAAPSAPPQASEIALRRAGNGERVTGSVAKEILGTLRKQPPQRRRKASASPPAKLRGQLLEALETFRQRWDPDEVAALARQLRDFADSLEGQAEGEAAQ